MVKYIFPKTKKLFYMHCISYNCLYWEDTRSSPFCCDRENGEGTESLRGSSEACEAFAQGHPPLLRQVRSRELRQLQRRRRFRFIYSPRSIQTHLQSLRLGPPKGILFLRSHSIFLRKTWFLFESRCFFVC